MSVDEHIKALKVGAGCIHHLFESQVDLRPHAPALVMRDYVRTYQQVEDRANQMARFLISQGVSTGDAVALYASRTEETIIGILAVLKAGAFYVPIAPDSPVERLHHVIEDAGAHVVLTEDNISNNVPAECLSVVLDDTKTRQRFDLESTDRLRPRFDDNHDPVCQVIYTSGTTGAPKGTMTAHRNVVAFVRSFNQICQLTSNDRVYQGFSLTFDGSIEEIWMAFAHGAALVPGPPELAKLGNETAAYLNEKEVTFFSSVPTFLSMIQAELPTVRILVTGGEACPITLVDRFATPDRRMLNVYGPTEATVNSTVWECQPGTQVTIGTAMPDYSTYILDEDGNPVPPGTPGELYVGGVGVALGYLNRPELTDRHFLPDPFNDSPTHHTMYRTGDLVSETADGEILFLGRVDQQVKIRGFRIELEEIESVLASMDGIRSAGVRVWTRGEITELAAFVEIDDASYCDEQRGETLSFLRQHLPEYMIPAWLDVVDQLPRLESGKLNRKLLPEPQQSLVNTDRKIAHPTTPLEKTIAAICEDVFEISPISIDDNLFLDLGGDSLLVAVLTSQLDFREDISIPIRTVYEAPTIRQLAEIVEQKQQHLHFPKHQTDYVSPAPSWKRGLCYVAQMLSCIMLYGLIGMPIVLSVLTCDAVAAGELSRIGGISLLATIGLLSYPTGLMIGVAAKWLLIGRYSSGRYALWSWFYFRFWLVNRIFDLNGSILITGTPLMNVYYRLLGANVGPRCVIDTSLCTAFDVVSIGADSCIGAETHISGYRVESGVVTIAPIDIGERCYVGARSYLGHNTVMDDGAQLGDLSMLADHGRIPAGRQWSGSPASPSSISLPSGTSTNTSRIQRVLFGALHGLSLQFLLLAIGLCQIPGGLIIYEYAHLGIAQTIGCIFLSALSGTVLFCTLGIVIKRLIVPTVRPGRYSVCSLFYVRKWIFDQYMFLSNVIVHSLYATIFFPTWLRWLGAKIGTRSEVSTVSQVNPDLIEIGEECFLADGCRIGGRRFINGEVHLDHNIVGSRSFVGNSAVLPPGDEIGSGSLLGVLSISPEEHQQIPDNTEWLGSPSFPLPHRRRVTSFDSDVIFNPGLWTKTQRVVVDAIRVLLPAMILVTGIYGAVSMLSWLNESRPVWQVLLASPFVMTGAALFFIVAVISCKWLFMGRFRPEVKPLWCQYVWWNEVVNGLWETVATPFVSPMLGTPFVNWVLRGIGIRVGKRVYMGTLLFSEFDLVSIGDDTCLNSGVVVQTHLFEDRIMKSSTIEIGNRCSVSNLGTIIYDTKMEDNARLGPLSLLMKSETARAGKLRVGVPTQES